MKHIKSKMLAFTISAVILSCIAANTITILLLSNLYMEELYTTSENNARQILLTTDSIVNTVESSLSLILDSRSTNTLLTQTRFNREDGNVYLAYQDLDSILSNFKIQFEKFSSLLFWSRNAGSYRYNFYNKDSLEFYANRAPSNLDSGLLGNGEIRWEGLYNMENQLNFSDDKYCYLVSKIVISPSDMQYEGYAMAFFEADLFTSVFTDVEEKTGGRVILLGKNERAIAGFETPDIGHITEARAFLRDSGENVTQYVSNDGEYLNTIVRSEATGWVLVYSAPLRLLTQRINVSIILGISITLFILVITLIFVYRYVNKLSSSIVDVSVALQTIGGNDFSVRLQTQSRDEIGTIYRGFNAMAENLDILFNKAIEEERSKKEAEIRALFYQIKPHFLYNTLASIRMYAMMEGSDQTADMLATLNRLLRNTIDTKDHLITLEEELENLKDYIAIHNVRYNRQIVFLIEPDSKTLRTKVPNMILQPVVENAIEHGISQYVNDDSRHPYVKLTSFLENGDLVIMVEDNGTGMSDKEIERIFEKNINDSRKGHIGLQNIHERLQTLYGEEYGISIASEKDCFTRIFIRVKGETDAANSDR